MWEPAAVAEGQCETPSFDELAVAPLPPGFRVLVHGNSHLRQVSPRTRIDMRLCPPPARARDPPAETTSSTTRRRYRQILPVLEGEGIWGCPDALDAWLRREVCERYRP